MARNRKNQSAAIRFAPAMWALMLCLLIGGSGVGYVWLKGQIRELGLQKGKRERKLVELKDQNDKLRRYLQELRLPKRLDARVKELNLGLVPASPSQVQHLTEWKSDAPQPAVVPQPQRPLAPQQMGSVRMTRH